MAPTPAPGPKPAHGSPGPGVSRGIPCAGWTGIRRATAAALTAVALAACGGGGSAPADAAASLELTAPAAWAAAQVEFGDEAPAATVTAGQADFSAAASGVVQAWRPALAGCGDGCAAPALLLLLPAGQERASLRSAPTTVRPAVRAAHCVDRNGLAVPCQAGWVR